jgi:hypothetical protein
MRMAAIHEGRVPGPEIDQPTADLITRLQCQGVGLHFRPALAPKQA